MFLTSDLVALMVPTSTLEDMDIYFTMLIFAVIRPYVSPTNSNTHLVVYTLLTPSLKPMIHSWQMHIINFSKFTWKYLTILARMITDAGHQKNKLLKAVPIH